jgi:hypothetical protein
VKGRKEEWIKNDKASSPEYTATEDEATKNNDLGSVVV